MIVIRILKLIFNNNLFSRSNFSCNNINIKIPYRRFRFISSHFDTKFVC